jgi:hypothetical protein
MSFSEIQAALPSLSPAERESLQELLFALEEGVSIEEWRAMNAALEEELADPSPAIPADDVFAKMDAKFRPHAA